VSVTIVTSNHTLLWLSPYRPTDGGDDLNHLYCCDPDWSLCGRDISDLDEHEVSDADLCVVCRELEDVDAPCRVPSCQWPGTS